MKAFAGTVLQRAFAGRTRAPSSGVLAALRTQFPLLGRGSQALILRLHSLEGATPHDRAELFRLGAHVRLNALAFGDANTFAAQALDERLTTSPDPGQEIRGLLAIEYPDGWSVAVPRAIGNWLGAHPESIRDALSVLFAPGTSTGMGIVALGEAMRSDATSSVIAHVIGREPAQLTSVEAGAICAVIVAVATDLTIVEKLSVGEWLAKARGTPITRHLPALLALSDASVTARTAALALLRSLDPKAQARLAGKALRAVPSSVAELLSTEIFETFPDSVPSVDLAMTRIAAARAAAARSHSGQNTLLMYAMDASRRVSSASVQAIVKLPPATLLAMAPSLPNLLDSPYPYVRVTVLDLMRRLLPVGLPGTTALAVASRPVKYADAATLQALFRFLGDAAPLLKLEPAGTLTHIAQTLVDAVTSGGRKNRGTIRIGLRSLVPIVWEWGEGTRRIVAEFARVTLSSMDLADINDGERAMIDLLAALARYDHDLLARLVADCGPWHARNVRALACALRRCDGAQSQLVERLLQSAACPAEVTTAILEWRGA